MKVNKLIKIEYEARRKILASAKKMSKGEIGGFLTGEIDELGKLTIKGSILLKQKQSSSNFQIDDDDLMEYTKNATDEELASIIGWWHSHGKHGAFWSPDDEATTKRLSEFFGGICVSVVVNSKGKEVWKISILNKRDEYLVLDGVRPFEKPDLSKIFLTDDEEVEIDEKVEEGEYEDLDSEAYGVCTECAGTGYALKSKRGGKKYAQGKKYYEYDGFWS